MPFSTTIKVRFGDVDPAGFVYYPVIFHYLHVAFEEFFASECGITYQRLLDKERIGFPTVKSDAEFLSPLRYGDELEVGVLVSNVGRSSLTLEYSVRRTHQGQICAKAIQVHVAMNMDDHRSVVIPEKYRKVFLNCASR